MNSETILIWLWCAHPVLQSVVAVVFWRRGLHKQFPVFFAYLLAQTAMFAVLFPLRQSGNYGWFFWSYWSAAAINAILGGFSLRPMQ